MNKMLSNFNFNLNFRLTNTSNTVNTTFFFTLKIKKYFFHSTGNQKWLLPFQFERIFYFLFSSIKKKLLKVVKMVKNGPENNTTK